MSCLEYENECVPHQPQIRTWVSHTLNNTGDLVPRDQPRFLLQRCIESLEVSWCQYYASDPLSKNVLHMFNCILYDFLVTVKAASLECVIAWFYSKVTASSSPLPQYRRKTHYLVL